MLTLDVVHVVERVPRANEKVPELAQSVAVGGPAANAALTVAALGAPVHLVAGFGRSPFTSFVAAALETARVQWHDAAAEARGGSPVSTILLTRGTGDRAVVGGAAPVLPGDAAVPTGIVEEAAAVLLDGHALPLAFEAASRAREAAVPVLLDGGSYKPGTERLLPNVDLAILSADFHPPDGTDPLSWVQEHGCRYAARSGGPDPVVLDDGHSRRSLPVAQVDVVDTLGAGDVLHGAAAYAVARCGLTDVARVLRFAIEVASLSCRHAGALGWAEHPVASRVAHRLSTDLLHTPVDKRSAG